MSGASGESHRSGVVRAASGSFAAAAPRGRRRAARRAVGAFGSGRSGNGSMRSGAKSPATSSSAARMRRSATRHHGDERILVQDERGRARRGGSGAARGADSTCGVRARVRGGRGLARPRAVRPAPTPRWLARVPRLARVPELHRVLDVERRDVDAGGGLEPLEARGGVHLHDLRPGARLEHVDAGDLEPHHPRRLHGRLGVLALEHERLGDAAAVDVRAELARAGGAAHRGDHAVADDEGAHVLAARLRRRAPAGGSPGPASRACRASPPPRRRCSRS